MESTEKSSAIENFLTEIGGNRKETIRQNKCHGVFGCGKDVSPEEFRDEQSLTEYRISGLCMSCQDDFFGHYGE